MVNEAAAKKPEVVKELKFKYGGGRITEDETVPKMREEISVLFPWCIQGREWPFAGLCRRLCVL